MIVPVWINHANNPEQSCVCVIGRVINSWEIRRIMESDFFERSIDHNPISLDDMNFLKQLKSAIHKLPNDHYEMPFSFRSGLPELPNNNILALCRLQGHKTRMQKDQRYHQHYTSLMNDLLQRGYAEPVAEDKSNGTHVWYMPHHGVYHLQKPDKLCVVFDCSASYRSESLNQQSLQGPDQTNGLLDVLARFGSIQSHLLVMSRPCSTSTT